MSEKRVTVSLVQITEDTRPEGLMVGKETYFRLPGADYSQTHAGHVPSSGVRVRHRVAVV